MRDLTLKALPHMTRHYRSNTHWYIPHDAGRLTIVLSKIKPQATHYIAGATYYKNATTTVSVSDEEGFNTALAANSNKLFYDKAVTAKWILPDGTVVEGLSVDVDVPEGETLCICSDFYSCGVDMSGCDILRVAYRDLPPFQGGVRMRSYGRGASTPMEMIPPKSILGAAREFFPGGYRCIGTASSPSKVRVTVKEINALTSVGTWKSRIQIRYAPDITGDLADIGCWSQKLTWNIWGTSTVRDYEAMNVDPLSSATKTDFSIEDGCMSFHHCGVHGVPNLFYGSKCIDWEYYACPNASPEDFDGLIEEIFEHWIYCSITDSVDGIGFVWNANNSANSYIPTLTCPGETYQLIGYSYEAGKPYIGAYGTLKISNRTADPVKRAERLAILRAAGWTVEEIDDSLEEGLYATV